MLRRLAICFLMTFVSTVSNGSSPVARAAAPDKPYSLDKRVPWTTSRVSGSPDPALEFRTVRVFAKVKLDNPTDAECLPDGKRWLICQQWGLIQAFANDPAVEKADPFLDIRYRNPRTGKLEEKHQIWSMTFHPRFAENGFFYVCYHDSTGKAPLCRISRFHVDPNHLGDPPHCDPATETVILEWPALEDHFGGCLKFGKDGCLYFSIGDGSPYGDHKESGQDISDLQASIHRIDVDRPDGDKRYSVPSDNPFVDFKGARPEIWAYGLRNVWKMSIDRETGELWAADVGQDLWESIFHIEKGGNYGWSVVEGTHPFRPERKVGPTPILKPVVEHEHSLFRSITGGFVYRGKAFPELVGQYVYADFDTGQIWAFKYEGGKPTRHRQLADTPLKIVGWGEEANGELLILDYTGQMHRLLRTPPVDPDHPPPPFPRKLSETGLFTSTAEARVAPGLIPYSINSPLWSDNAHKERFMAVPNNEKIEYRTTNGWQFPNQSVLVKTFSLDLEQGNPASRRRLETRILHLEHNHWRGYTYLWNDEQTDAALLEGRASLDRKYTIRDASVPGGVREQTWHFPSRAECTLCHTMPANFVLGLSTLQMNRDQDYGGKGDGGTVDNQIRTLEHLGLFKESVLEVERREAKDKPKPTPIDQLPKLPDPKDAAISLEARARSYLHANCAHCHMKWGGGNAVFWLPFEKSLSETETVNVLPQHGNLNIGDARLLVPGAPDRSLIWQRMTRLDAQRMPRVASSVVDEDAVKLIEAWIKQLPPGK